MNMTATQNSHQDHDIRDEISYIAGLNQSHVRQIMDYSKAFLDKAGIEDIQLQLTGEQTGWFSMIRGNTQAQPCIASTQNSPCFRAKEGGDYRVNSL